MRCISPKNASNATKGISSQSSVNCVVQSVSGHETSWSNQQLDDRTRHNWHNGQYISITVNTSGITANKSGITASTSGITASISGITVSMSGITASISGITASMSGITASLSRSWRNPLIFQRKRRFTVTHILTILHSVYRQMALLYCENAAQNVAKLHYCKKTKHRIALYLMQYLC